MAIYPCISDSKISWVIPGLGEIPALLPPLNVNVVFPVQEWIIAQGSYYAKSPSYSARKRVWWFGLRNHAAVGSVEV